MRITGIIEQDKVSLILSVPLCLNIDWDREVMSIYKELSCSFESNDRLARIYTSLGSQRGGILILWPIWSSGCALFCCFLRFLHQKPDMLISLTSGGRTWQECCKNWMRNQNNSSETIQMLLEALTNRNESVLEGQTPNIIKISTWCHGSSSMFRQSKRPNAELKRG